VSALELEQLRRVAASDHKPARCVPRCVRVIPVDHHAALLDLALRALGPDVTATA
jgi:hypothetical protein